MPEGNGWIHSPYDPVEKDGFLIGRGVADNKNAAVLSLYLLRAFRELGLSCFEPYGAFYTFPCIKEFGMTSDEFATRFLEEEKVAVVPGTAFGACGEGFLRISYAYSLEQLKEALGRLSHFVARLRAEKGAR